MNYVYSVGFFVAVFLSPVLYLVWLWGVELCVWRVDSLKGCCWSGYVICIG